MNIFKSLAILVTSITMFSCAIPQGIYETTQGGTLHPEFPQYTNLDCTELSAQRNKMKLGWAFSVAVAILFCLKVLEFVLKNYF